MEPPEIYMYCMREPPHSNRRKLPVGAFRASALYKSFMRTINKHVGGKSIIIPSCRSK
jgi:hypothetical protein